MYIQNRDVIPWERHVKVSLWPTWTDPPWRGSTRERTGAAAGTETNSMRVGLSLRNAQRFWYWGLYENGELLRNTQECAFMRMGKLRIVEWVDYCRQPKQSGRVEFHRCPSQNTVLSPDIKAPRLHLNLTKKMVTLQLFETLLQSFKTSKHLGCIWT